MLGLALGVTQGCGDDDDDTSVVCSVGDTRECVGPGACRGAQECLANGSGFKTCECGGTGEGGSDGQGGSSSGPKPGDGGTSSNTMGGMPPNGEAGGPHLSGTGGMAEAGAPNGGAGGAPEYACNPIGHVGCESNQNCSHDSAAVPECVTAGNNGALEACNFTSECAPGLFCNFNNCVKPCANTDDCGSVDATIKCGLGRDQGYGLVASCVKNCDPLTQNCPGGQACYLGSCLTPTLAHTQGQECGFGTDCAEGLDCLVELTGDQELDCSSYCSTVVANPCGSGKICYPLSEVFPTVPASWGICAIDPNL